MLAGITACFSEEELKTLCFEIGINYEDLPAQGRVGNARELIAFCDRHGQRHRLNEQCKECRPSYRWPDSPQPPPAIEPTITDPCLEYQAFYLAEALGDQPGQADARRQAFLRELQRAADALGRWAGVAPAPVSLGQLVSADSSQLTLHYDSAGLGHPGGSTWARLLAYRVHDTYLLRCIAECPGVYAQPGIFAKIQGDLAWQPHPEHGDLLGLQQIFYTSRFNGAPDQLARAVLGKGVLWHGALTCGDLYCQAAPGVPYLLVGTTEDQEHTAGSFFEAFILPLGWYTYKMLGQKRRYFQELVPVIEADLQRIAVELSELQALRSQGGSQPDTAADRPIQAVERMIRTCGALLDTMEQIPPAIATNLTNYQLVIAIGDLFIEPGPPPLFVKQQQHLGVIPKQIHDNLQKHRGSLDEARERLRRLRVC